MNKNFGKMMDIEKEGFVEESVAFEQDHRGYHFKAIYMEQPKGEALIQISKDGETVREFMFPSYKIWNIAAHADDIVNGLEADSDSGLRIAGSTGFGGNVYNEFHYEWLRDNIT